MEEVRYRLRKGTTVMGYMRKFDQNHSVFYSKDAFWWTGRAISYDEIDEWTGLRDLGNIPIYEWDIVAAKTPGGDEELSAVLWHKEGQHFALVGLESLRVTPLEVKGVPLFSPRDLRVHAYLFDNPALIQRLGLEE